MLVLDGAVLNAVKAGKGTYGYNAGSGEYGGISDRSVWICRVRRALPP